MITIDYNAGETFTPLFTITSEMRIAIEYQYSDRNYTRFVTYAGATHQNGVLVVTYILKMISKPAPQNLTKEQALF
jgi:hypothetical protein